jgi:hypothetical protein
MAYAGGPSALNRCLIEHLNLPDGTPLLVWGKRYT